MMCGENSIASTELIVLVVVVAAAIVTDTTNCSLTVTVEGGDMVAVIGEEA
jgi:hypothetical protein